MFATRFNEEGQRWAREVLSTPFLYTTQRAATFAAGAAVNTAVGYLGSLVFMANPVASLAFIVSPVLIQALSLPIIDRLGCLLFRDRDVSTLENLRGALAARTLFNGAVTLISSVAISIAACLAAGLTIGVAPYIAMTLVSNIIGVTAAKAIGSCFPDNNGPVIQLG